MLDIYDKIYNSDFTTYDKTGINLLEGKKKEKVGKLMMGFIDKYVLNTPESKEVLNEYLQNKKNTRLNKMMSKINGREAEH